MDDLLKILPKLLTYCPDSGKLYWKERRGVRPSDIRFNKRFAGKEAFTAQKDGYFCGAIFNKAYRAHRVAFALMAGRWPQYIDHINGDRSDNRWENLREVDNSGNQRNAARSRNNTSGCVGVYFDRRRSRWTAQISVYGRNNFLGAFEDKFDAVLARLLGERKFGFHKNHGRI